MKKKLKKHEVLEKIDSFFKQDNLDPKKVKKIKRLAMLYNIKMGRYRRRFCNSCYSDLKNGKVRITKSHKTIECLNCGGGNKWKIN